VTDVVVIGAGPNGLVAANLLADAGLEVMVLEAQPTPGGAVRSGEVTEPGFRHDLFSAFYPLAAASPALAALDLDHHGLVWRRAPAALSHVFGDGRAATIFPEPERTAASVDRFAPGDGAAWLQLVREWEQVSEPLVSALLLPFPPVGPMLKLMARLRRPREMGSFVRKTLLPVRRLAAERFRGDGAAMLLAGNTLHTDLSPESALGGFYGWLLAMLGQTVGFPVPEGGSGALTAALVRRLQAAGGRLICGQEVTRITLQSGRVTGVVTSGGASYPARAVLADVAAPRLYRELVGYEHLPARFVADLQRFEWDHGTFKVDWALSQPIPWKATEARAAGTVHLGEGMDHLTSFAAELAAGRVPSRPFILFGQMGRADPTRSPAGTETAWAYTHVPNLRLRPEAATWDPQVARTLSDRLEEAVEMRAPGFRDTILGRHIQTPADLENNDANLFGGAVNGGTSQVHQQLIFRPTLGRAGPTTPVAGLYLASASAHPGGGVHGACGANAARALLRHRGGRPRMGQSRAQ
jgi:phytoene dehydrogenase-like protein